MTMDSGTNRPCGLLLSNIISFGLGCSELHLGWQETGRWESGKGDPPEMLGDAGAHFQRFFGESGVREDPCSGAVELDPLDGQTTGMCVCRRVVRSTSL